MVHAYFYRHMDVLFSALRSTYAQELTGRRGGKGTRLAQGGGGYLYGNREVEVYLVRQYALPRPFVFW